jgi:hypothetical protein
MRKYTKSRMALGFDGGSQQPGTYIRFDATPHGVEVVASCMDGDIVLTAENVAAMVEWLRRACRRRERTKTRPGRPRRVDEALRRR